MKIFQSIQTIAIVGLLLLFLWQWNCNKPKGTTTIIHYVPVKDSTGFHQPIEIRNTPGTIPVSVPVYVTIPPTATMPGRIDTVWKPLDSLEIVKAYFGSRYYLDSLVTKYGPIYVKNKVTQNRLDSQNIVANLLIPETTIYKQRGQLYLGFEGLGNRNTLLNGVGGNLAWKSPGSKIYEVGVVKVNQVPLQFKAGFKMVLSLRKK